MRKSTLVMSVIVVILAVGIGLAVGHKSNNGSTYSSQNSSNTSSSTNSSQVPAAGSINIKNMMFTPSQISIQRGGTVTWTNNDTVAHTVTDDLSNVGGPASGSIPPGSTYSFTFAKAGSYQYHCTIHPSLRGTIVVK